MTRPTTARPVQNLIGACKMTNVKNMTDAALTEYLIQSAEGVESRVAYAAGYFESTLLTLMSRFPEVRREIEDRVRFRMKDSV